MTQFDQSSEDAKLTEIREKEEEDLARLLSDKYGLSYTDLSVVPVNMDALRLIPEETAREAEAVAFDRVGKKLSIALRNPQNQKLADILSDFENRGTQVERFLVSGRSLEKAFERYQDLSYAHVTTAGVFDIAEGKAGDINSINDLKAHLDETLSSKKTAQTSRIFEDIVAAALSMGASDVHIEPEEHNVRLRLRLDGLLTDAYTLDEKTYRQLDSRIKLLSGLKLNVEKRAQDGRFTIQAKGKDIEVRTSIIPGNYGEAIVLRLLDPSTLGRTFEEMGVHPKLLERLRTEIKRPNGMLLTTGPTGSGKTTTLYTFLHEVHEPEIKIITIEDPVEYHLDGIVQTQVDHKDYTFASGLRSILRQDPDVILVGEIRDKEVAETALQAALTGHFVFSTLHTNNAAGTFPRLVDLGADPKIFASAITVAMAQRLVRTLDPATKQARATTPEEKQMMEKVFSAMTDKSLVPASFDTVYEAVASEESNGYKGRMGVHEGIFMDEELGVFLRDNPSEGDIAKHVERQGYPTMLQDGLIKVLQGHTTFEELARVVDLPR
ncbi:MAG TPA: GspE/PulE family protein [Candidatus Paceibacterota bacterium]|nr:GspE/PulE family protein [Candidatus Paceibacterota bacterium]